MRLPTTLLCLVLAVPASGLAQVGGSAPPPPVIDTIIIVRENVFTAAQADSSFGYRAANAIHFRTQPWIIRSTVLFRQGDTLNMNRVTESERTLRSLNIFRSVAIDTATRDGRLAVVIDTRDAWSTNPKFSIAGSGGDVTLTIGLSESNFLGTATSVTAAYVKLVDRDGLDLQAQVPRVGHTRLSVGGSIQALSEGNTGSWNLGVPYRAFPDPWAAQVNGNAAQESIFQFRRNAGVLDSTTYQHSLFSNQLTIGIAAMKSPQRYLRLGINAILRTEEYVLEGNTAPVFDSITATPGLTVDYQQSDFMIGRYFQGFGQAEDINLSPSIDFTTWVAAEGLGYERGGIGPAVSLSAGKKVGSGVVVGSLDANGLFSSAGLDSGRVVFRGTWATKLALKKMMFVHVEAGTMKAPPPGDEFDLGLIYGPRTYGAHASVGTETVWGTLEMRDYRWDSVLGFLGIGYAAWVDYGAAWYDNQTPSFIGNFGVGLRIGSSIAPHASAGRIDVGYRFGPGFEGNRFGVSFGGSYDIFTGSLTSFN